jgi:hypothetical protein
MTGYREKMASPSFAPPCARTASARWEKAADDFVKIRESEVERWSTIGADAHRV